MKFGHYTPDELGIRRGITCAMFTSSGADVDCATYSEQQLAKARRQYAGLLKEAAAAKEQVRKLEKKLASAPDEQVAAIKSEILRFRQDVVDKIADKLNAAIKSQTNLSECKASREVYQEYSQTCDILSSLTSEILKRETKIKRKQRQANKRDVKCSVGSWDSREAAEHGLSILSGYVESQIRKGVNIQQLMKNVRARISEGLNEMAKAGCSDKDRKAAAKACDRILETLRARGAKCARTSLDDMFNESDKVCEDHIRAILQNVKEARRTVKGWAGTSEGAKVNYKLQAKYREGAKDLLSRIKKRGKVKAAKLSELEMMIQQICGITAHTEWEFQRIVKEQQK